MSTKTPQTPKATDDGLKAQLDVLLAEYNSTRAIIENHRSGQSQLDNIALGALGLSIPLYSYLNENNLLSSGVVMLLSFLFFIIGFNQLRQERVIFTTARYNDSIIRKKSNAILSQLTNTQVSVFELEEFFIRKGVDTFPATWVAVLLSCIASTTIGIIVLTSQFFLHPINDPTPWSALEIILLSANIVAIIVNMGLAFYIAQERFSYYRNYLQEE